MLQPITADNGTLRQAFSGFPCGVAALAGIVDGAEEVLIVSSFTVGVSQDPPLVMFAVQHTSSTWPKLQTAPRIGVSILGDAYADRTRQLAGKDRNARLTGITTTRTDDGAVLLHDAPIWLDCSVWATYPAGDHDIVVLRVEELAVEFDYQPLVWHRSGFAALA
ncbi:flavin reductase family protein [Curtobacterium pusillum]|uniref:flavin reductase family protein n=1 Tax=Curtobacterium pusillum TaxID=69373 RepID=UPI00119F2289|nr:flavin reductase family protein [Curtobacterium pusillum]